MTNLLPRDVVSACVTAGDVDTRYYRVGRGEPVLMLIGDTATLSALLATFPRDLRAIAPNPHALELDAGSGEPPGDFAVWLRGFLDALGLQRVSVVADSAFAAPALAFARADPERVTRVVVVGDESEGSSGEIPARRVPEDE